MADPLSYFGITPPGKPLSQFFPQGDDDFRAQLEERPVNRASHGTGVIDTPRAVQLATSMGVDPNSVIEQARKMQEDMQTQTVIKGLQGLDYGSKDFTPSVAKLLSKNYLAAQNPAVQNIILKLKALSGQQTKDSGYDLQAANAAKGLLSIPEDDPEYDSKFQKYINDLDPQVLTHPRLGSLIERGMHNSSVVRSKKSAQQQERLAVEKEARRAGVPVSKYDNLQDLSDAVADKVSEATKQKELYQFLRTDKETAKELSSAMSQLRAPTSGSEWDKEKALVMGKVDALGNGDPKQMTAEDWHQAHPLALQARLAKARTIADQIEMMTGVNPMKGGQSPSTGITAPAASPATPQAPLSFTSHAEAEGAGLPKGTKIIIAGRPAHIE